ncbi:unnamed protein product [Linum trigynum]|uniref:Uncharacterized protein n=1 Tax=Linum trigynum TaxID=586398 RepID=A0AAV2CVR5_9ROSI
MIFVLSSPLRFSCLDRRPGSPQNRNPAQRTEIVRDGDERRRLVLPSMARHLLPPSLSVARFPCPSVVALLYDFDVANPPLGFLLPSPPLVLSEPTACRKLLAFSCPQCPVLLLRYCHLPRHLLPSCAFLASPYPLPPPPFPLHSSTSPHPADPAMPPSLDPSLPSVRPLLTLAFVQFIVLLSRGKGQRSVLKNKGGQTPILGEQAAEAATTIAISKAPKLISK